MPTATKFTCQNCEKREECEEHLLRNKICDKFVLKSKKDPALCNVCENLGHDCPVCDGESHFNKEDEMQGKKFDDGKAKLSMLPRGGMEGAARALMFGEGKYGRDNWRTGFKDSRLIDASLRHITAYMNGERNDHESGLCHIDHALFSLMVVAEQLRKRETGKVSGEDDLPVED